MQALYGYESITGRFDDVMRAVDRIEKAQKLFGITTDAMNRLAQWDSDAMMQRTAQWLAFLRPMICIYSQRQKAKARRKKARQRKCGYRR